jgi:type II secretory pathway pseudopilin PulG
LAELLVTIAIMGIAIVTIVGGLATAILLSSVHRQHATADTVVRSAAETIQDRKFAWNSSGAYTVPAQSGITPSISTTCWNGDLPPTFGACPNGDKGLQKIIVSASSGKTTESVTILKRRT